MLTGTAFVFGTTWTNIAIGNDWQEVTVDLSNATGSGADPTMVIMFGLQIVAGQGTTTAARPTAAVFYVDSFSLE